MVLADLCKKCKLYQEKECEGIKVIKGVKIEKCLKYKKGGSQVDKSL